MAPTIETKINRCNNTWDPLSSSCCTNENNEIVCSESVTSFTAAGTPAEGLHTVTYGRRPVSHGRHVNAQAVGSNSDEVNITTTVGICIATVLVLGAGVATAMNIKRSQNPSGKGPRDVVLPAAGDRLGSAFAPLDPRVVPPTTSASWPLVGPMLFSAEGSLGEAGESMPVFGQPAAMSREEIIRTVATQVFGKTPTESQGIFLNFIAELTDQALGRALDQNPEFADWYRKATQAQRDAVFMAITRTHVRGNIGDRFIVETSTGVRLTPEAIDFGIDESPGLNELELREEIHIPRLVIVPQLAGPQCVVDDTIDPRRFTNTQMHDLAVAQTTADAARELWKIGQPDGAMLNETISVTALNRLADSLKAARPNGLRLEKAVRAMALPSLRNMAAHYETTNQHPLAIAAYERIAALTTEKRENDVANAAIRRLADALAAIPAEADGDNWFRDQPRAEADGRDIASTSGVAEVTGATEVKGTGRVEGAPEKDREGKVETRVEGVEKKGRGPADVDGKK